LDNSVNLNNIILIYLNKFVAQLQKLFKNYY